MIHDYFRQKGIMSFHNLHPEEIGTEYQPHIMTKDYEVSPEAIEALSPPDRKAFLEAYMGEEFPIPKALPNITCAEIRIASGYTCKDTKQGAVISPKPTISKGTIIALVGVALVAFVALS